MGLAIKMEGALMNDLEVAGYQFDPVAAQRLLQTAAVVLIILVVTWVLAKTAK